MMIEPLIFHGTPLTPRAALNALLPGRAACVSFWRPDDMEAVEALCPAIMFRQRRVLGMDGGAETRRVLVHPRGLDTLLSLARRPVVHAWTVGGDPRRAGRTFPAQRQPVAAMAVRSFEGRSALAHGRADRATAAPLRTVRPGLHRLGRGGYCAGLRGVVPPYGRGRSSAEPHIRRLLARDPHDARRARRAGIPLQQCGRDERCAERTSL